MSELTERLVAVRDMMKCWAIDRGPREQVREALADAANRIQALEAALKPFADLGVGSGPDDENDAAPYRLTRGSIRDARKALA